jgi:hypothetical protein
MSRPVVAHARLYSKPFGEIQSNALVDDDSIGARAFDARALARALQWTTRVPRAASACVARLP